MRHKGALGPGFFGPYIKIRHPILVKFGILMGIMIFHHHTNFWLICKQDSREISNFQVRKAVLRAPRITGT